MGRRPRESEDGGIERGKRNAEEGRRIGGGARERESDLYSSHVCKSLTVIGNWIW